MPRKTDYQRYRDHGFSSIIIIRRIMSVCLFIVRPTANYVRTRKYDKKPKGFIATVL